MSEAAAPPFQAMLLAAGLSTRLGPLSEQLPKPLLPVCNVPLLHWAVSHCKLGGASTLAVNLHHLGHKIREALGPRPMGLPVVYSEEQEILGTGGGIKRMARLLPRQPSVVLNAKIVVDLDLAQVVAQHRASGALATLVVRPHPQAEQWGAICVAPSGRVTRILDARAPESSEAPAYQFTGIHVLEPELIDAIPEQPTLRCVIRTAYMELLRRGAPIHGLIYRGYFYDHSTPARYLRGNLNLLRGEAAPAHSPGPLTGVAPSAVIDSGAQLIAPYLVGAGARVEAGARVGPAVVLGAGARVAQGVTLAESVVWPGCAATHSGRHLVLTPDGEVQAPQQGDPAARPR